MGKHKPAGGYDVWLDGVRSRMRAARESLGLSFRAAGERTGLPFASIQRTESGRVHPSLELLYSLAVGYGVPIGQILCEGEAAKAKRPKS